MRNTLIPLSQSKNGNPFIEDSVLRKGHTFINKDLGDEARERKGPCFSIWQPFIDYVFPHKHRDVNSILLVESI